MNRTLFFIAHQEIPRQQRERHLRCLREAGHSPKPLVADPFTRCPALLEFLHRADQSGSGIYVCLDMPDLVLSRLVAGHVKGSVVATVPEESFAKAAIDSVSRMAAPPFALIVPPTPEALVAWLGCAFLFENRQTAQNSSPAPTIAHASPHGQLVRGKFSEQDADWLEKVEKEFRPRLRETHRPPVTLKKTPQLDFSRELRLVVSTARQIAAAYNHALITPLHYLAAIASYPDCAGYELLRALGIATDTLADRALAVMPSTNEPSVATFAPSDEATELVSHSKRVARQRNRDALTTVDFVEGMLSQAQSLAATLLEEFGVTAARIEQVLREVALREEAASDQEDKRPPETTIPPVEIDPEEVRRLKEKFASLPRADTHKTVVVPVSEETIAKVESVEGASSKMAMGTGKNSCASAVISTDMDKKRPLILSCDPANPALEVVEQAADALLEGKLVAFPTETVYGLGVDATNQAALERLYAVKERERTRAIALLIHSTSQLRHIVREIPEGVAQIMEAFWPGPLTVVFRRHPKVFASLAPDDSIGIRMPDHYLALSILSMVGRPLATTSANLSGQAPARDAHEIVAQLGEKVDLIVDGGPCGNQPPSTVLSVIEKPYRILRVGPISQTQLEEVAKVPIVV